MKPFARRSWTRIATEGHSLSPLWTPDGLRVLFHSSLDLFWRAADGGTPAERLLERERAQYGTSWTPDGRLLIFDDVEPGTTTKYDIWVFPIGGKQLPLIFTENNESGARLSPDAKWKANH